MNRIYTAARRAFLRGEIDVTSDALKAVLTVSSFEEDIYEFYSSVSGDILGAPASLTTVALDATEPWVTADDIVFSDVPVSVAAGVVIWVDSGNPATSPLVAWIDRRGDTQPFALVTNGGDVTLKFPLNRVFRL